MERSGIAAHIKDPANGLIITQLAKLMPVSMSRKSACAAAAGGPGHRAGSIMTIS
jgi:hypothetical protein